MRDYYEELWERLPQDLEPPHFELRRHFPLIADNAHARLCVRAIAGWKPLTDPSQNTGEDETR